MSAIFFGKLKEILADLATLKSNVNATITSRAPASTALSSAVWTPAKAAFLDQAISEVGGGEVQGDTRNIQTFNSDGTFNVPTDFKGFMFITGCGGGGGGGDGFYSALGSSNNAGAGGGGGGGGCIRFPVWVDYSVTPTISVQVGDGGAAGLDGQDTLFGSILTLAGGADGGDAAYGSNGLGGVGGRFSYNSSGGSSANDSGVYTLMNPGLYPVWRDFRCGWYFDGANGGIGAEDGVAAENGGSVGDVIATIGTPEQYYLSQRFSAGFFGGSGGADEASASYTREYGGGGAGGLFGDGGGDAGGAAANGGGGGAGGTADDSPAGQPGGSGKLIVEWWT